MYSVLTSKGRYVEYTVYGQVEVDMYIRLCTAVTGRYVQSPVNGRVKLDMYSVQRAVYRVQCTVKNMLIYTVYSVCTKYKNKYIGTTYNHNFTM